MDRLHVLEHLIETLGPVLVLGVPAAVIAYQFWRAQGEGGMVSRLVGARVSRTVGEVPADASGATSVVLRVHRLTGGDADRAVALELDMSVASPLGSRVAAALSVDQAEELLALLESIPPSASPGGNQA